jgi:short-subunit dehydrogenase
MNFRDKTCWITGASSGIGKELAILLAHERAKLILSGSNTNLLNEVRAECLAYTNYCKVVPFDLSKPDEVERTANEVVGSYGPIYLLVNNGGITQRSLAIETSIEIDRKIMEIDYFSHVVITKIVIPGMLKAGEGFIAVTSSLTGKFGFHQRSAYSAAKHALQGFFETLRMEVKPHNISVTVVYPGFINTPISVRALDSTGKAHGVMDSNQKNGMSAQKCAFKYLKAVKRRKPEAVIGGKELIMFYLKRFFPFLFFKLIVKVKAT